jgi:hypothetical protein
VEGRGEEREEEGQEDEGEAVRHGFLLAGLLACLAGCSKSGPPGCVMCVVGWRRGEREKGGEAQFYPRPSTR